MHDIVTGCQAQGKANFGLINRVLYFCTTETIEWSLWCMKLLLSLTS